MQPEAFCNFPSFAVINSYDADAQVYIDALVNAGYAITSAEEAAIDRFFRDQKGETNPNYTTFDIYTNWVYFAPYIGNTAACNKFNAKIPTGNLSDYNLQFNGGITHNANGITGNGVNGYFNNNIIPSVVMPANRKTYVNYVRNNISGNYALHGCTNGLFVGDCFLPAIAGVTYSALSSSFGGGIVSTNTDGLWIETRDAATYHRVFKNGALFYSPNFAASTNMPIEDYGLARNFAGAPDRYAPYNLAFSGALNIEVDAAIAAFISNSINALQTALGRNVY